ncbi:MAG: nitrate- and nitrite sensing domain-containing protein [Campylobacterota bacterium]
MKIVLITLLLLVNVHAKSLFSNNSQEESAKYIAALKDLVISTQKTRGLTNSYLNGNTVALLLVFENKKEMKDAIGDMEASELSSDPVVNSRATAISQALIKLNRKSLEMEPSKAFEAYTEQIEQILMLAQTISRRNSKDLNPLGQDASTLMMEVILPMTEYVGRMRGMGSGIAAHKSISEDQKMKEFTMITEIDTLQNRVQVDMQAILAKHTKAYNANVPSTMNSIKGDTIKYVNLTKTTLVNTPNTIDPTDYFDQGTDLITLLIKLYDANNRALLEDSKGWL